MTGGAVAQTNADRQEQRLLSPVEGSGFHGAAYALCQHKLRGSWRRGDNGKLASHSRHDTAIVDHLLYLLGQRGQHPVAAFVAKAVIDGLEIVDVQQHDRQMSRLSVLRSRPSAS